MHIRISNHSDQPIYEQIRKQIQTQIVAGTLQSGELLPSIRVLAKELRISVITTKRAYEELEKDGFLEIVPGKGTFVAAKDVQRIQKEYYNRLIQNLKDAVELAAACHLELEQLQALLAEQYEEESPCPTHWS